MIIISAGMVFITRMVTLGESPAEVKLAYDKAPNRPAAPGEQLTEMLVACQR